MTDREIEVLSRECEQLLEIWTFSSDSRSAIAMKNAVAAEFGLTELVYNPNHHKVSSGEYASCQVAIRYLYERTQVELAAKGVDSIELFRGIKSQQFVTGAITSWTTDLNVATDFDGFDVKRENILVF